MDNLFHRVSVRQFKGSACRRRKIKEMLHAGMQAPSAGNQRPWVFYVVTNKDTIRRFQRSTSIPHAQQDSAHYCSGMQEGEKLSFPERFSRIWRSAPTTSGSRQITWAWAAFTLGFIRKRNVWPIRAAIDLPEEYDPFCLLAIGYPASDAPAAESLRRDEDSLYQISRKGLTIEVS